MATPIAATAVAGESVRDLLVCEKRQTAAGVVTISLASPDGAELPEWRPGAHIDLVLPEQRRSGSTRYAATLRIAASGESASCASRRAAAALRLSTTSSSPGT